jgi:hypothetical protein
MQPREKPYGLVVCGMVGKKKLLVLTPATASRKSSGHPSLSQGQDHRGANFFMCLAMKWP